MSALRHESADLLVVGAGPAGLAAAVEATAHGLSVLVVDDQPMIGGQAYRIGPGVTPPLHVVGSDWRRRRAVSRAFEMSHARHLPGVSVQAALPDGRLLAEDQGGQPLVLRGRAVLLACGALERPVPIPGWTLPGVMSVGAAQVLLRSSAVVPGNRLAMAGHGALLLLTAAQLARADARPRVIADTGVSPAQLGPGVLVGEHRERAARVVRWLTDIRAAGTRRWTRCRNLRIEGHERAEALVFEDRSGRTRRWEADTILLHDGLQPDLALARACGVPTRWNGRDFVPEADDNGLTPIPALWVAGDAAGILGPEAAAARGAIAAIDAAVRLGRLQRPQGERRAQPHRKILTRELRIADMIAGLAPRDRAPPDDIVVCRCTGATAGAVRAAVAAGASDPAEVARRSDCGTGACGGRICGSLLARVIAEARDRGPEEIGLPPPPVPVGFASAAVREMITHTP